MSTGNGEYDGGRGCLLMTLSLIGLLVGFLMMLAGGRATFNGLMIFGISLVYPIKIWREMKGSD